MKNFKYKKIKNALKLTLFVIIGLSVFPLCSMEQHGEQHSLDPWAAFHQPEERPHVLREADNQTLDALQRKLNAKINKKNQELKSLKSIMQLDIAQEEKENAQKQFNNVKKELEGLKKMEQDIKNFQEQKASEQLLLNSLPAKRLQGLKNKIARTANINWQEYKKQFIEKLSTNLSDLEKNQLKNIINLSPNIIESSSSEELNQKILFVKLATENNNSPFDGFLSEPGTTSKTSIPEKSVSYNNKFSVSQKRSLSQRRSKDEQTNLCGYYALFNAQCLAKNNKNKIMNRDAFVYQFAQMLQSIAEIRKHMPPQINQLDNLTNDEISDLLEKQNLLDKVLLVDQNLMNGISSNIPKDTLVTGFGIKEKQIELIDQFKSKKKNELIILYLVPKGANHYLTIHAQRKPRQNNPDFIAFDVYDSLGINYVDPQSDIREKRLLPLYEILK